MLEVRREKLEGRVPKNRKFSIFVIFRGCLASKAGKAGSKSNLNCPKDSFGEKFLLFGSESLEMVIYF